MENETCFSRLQLMVIVRTTTSTLSFCRAAIRWLVGMARKITASRSPRMFSAMARTRSMSNPSSWSLSLSAAGLRYPQLKLFWSTPAISFPRRLIFSMSGPLSDRGGRLASGSVQSSALVCTACAVPSPEASPPKTSAPPWESGSRVSEAVTAQATAMPVTPPQPRSPPRVDHRPVRFLVIAPPLTGTPRACG